MRMNLSDQAALSFLTQQATYIEAEVYKIQYPELQYKALIPVDTSAPDWVGSITFFSMDNTGRAKFFHAAGTDMPYADVTREKHEETVEMAAIGYQ